MKVVNSYISAQLLIVAAFDAVLAVASFYLGNFLVPATLLDAVPSEGLLLHLNVVIFAPIVVACQAAMGLYSSQQRYEIEGVIARTIIGIALATLSLAFADFLFEFAASRTEWLMAVVVATALLCVGRILTLRLIDVEIFRRRVLIYGAGKRAARLLELRRRSDQRGFRIVGFLPAGSERELIDDPRVMDPSEKTLLELARQRRATEIVVAVDDRRRDFRIAELLECKMAGLRVVDLLGFLERETGRVKVDLMSPSWLIFSEGFQRIRGNQIGFRVLDIFASVVLFVVTAPVTLLIALAILVFDGRPVLYRQRRVGLVGQEFTLYKFRSMRKDAEAGGEAVWASPEDSRVTSLGRFLRKYRLDEIPQLINVFRGDMSFVGPRPERPEFVQDLAQKIPYYHERHCVKPGITGWAQLCYPYGASEQDAVAKLEYDMYYVKHRSLIFNLIILLQTVEVVLWQKGSR